MKGTFKCSPIVRREQNILMIARIMQKVLFSYKDFFKGYTVGSVVFF